MLPSVAVQNQVRIPATSLNSDTESPLMTATAN